MTKGSTDIHADDSDDEEESSSGEESVDLKTVPVRKKFDDEEDSDDVSFGVARKEIKLISQGCRQLG